MPLKLCIGGQPGTLRLQETNSAGRVVDPMVDFDAPPTWTVDTPTVATIAPATDGLSVAVTQVGPGTATVSASAAIGGAPFTASEVVTVTPGAKTVTGLRIVADAPLTPAKVTAAPAASAPAPATTSALAGLATGLRPAPSVAPPAPSGAPKATVTNQPTK